MGSWFPIAVTCAGADSWVQSGSMWGQSLWGYAEADPVVVGVVVAAVVVLAVVYVVLRLTGNHTPGRQKSDRANRDRS